MAKESQQLVLAFFDTEAAAQQAADELKKWDKANDDVKAGAVGVIALDAKGKRQGRPAWQARRRQRRRRSARVLGVIAAIPTGGLSLLGGVAGGAAGGGVLGSFFHRHLGLTDADRERISKELAGGKAAVGVLAEAQEAGAFAQKLQELGGKPETHEVTDEGLEQAAAAVAAAPIQPQAASAPVQVSSSTSAKQQQYSRREKMANQPDKHLRSVLPIPDIRLPGLTTYDAKDPDSKFPPIEPLRPPAGAPNVLVILIDDAGFGSSSAFGGPCDTPTFEKLTEGWHRLQSFSHTALCAPTRQALMTGRNHHSAGMGNITETATAAPGQSSLRPNTMAPIALTLKYNGFSTAMFGKCHEVPVWETSPMGPFDRWPAGGGGFEYFYGFIGGENNQWDPALYEGTTPIEPPATPEEGYHLTEDLADHAISWVRQQKALMPDKPFFMYFSPGATHAPHHVPKEWADKYKGQFAHGWDKQREITFAKQKELGVIPQDAELHAAPRRNPGVG